MKVKELENLLNDANPDAEVELLTQDYNRICHNLNVDIFFNRGSGCSNILNSVIHFI